MKKILIIEDDLIIAQTYHYKLTAEGFQTALAMDGEGGLELASTFEPDLVVMDLMLPGLNGLEVLTRIRSHDTLAKTPVLFLSSHAVEAGSRLDRAAGLNRSLVKSETSPSKVVQTIQEMFSYREKVLSHPIQLARDEFGGKIEDFIGPMRAIISGLTSVPEEDYIGYQALEKQAEAFTFSSTELGFTRLSNFSAAVAEMALHLGNWPFHATASTTETFKGAFDSMALLAKAGMDAESMPAPIALVIEDEEVSQKVAQSALERAGVRTVVTGSGEAAIALVASNHFDLVLLDFGLPGVDGLQVCTEIRKHPEYAQTPVVFITSVQDFSERERFFAAGATDFISKPVMFAELAVKVLTHVLKVK